MKVDVKDIKQEDINEIDEKISLFWGKWDWLSMSFRFIQRFLLFAFLIMFFASIILFIASFFSDSIVHPWYSYLFLAISCLVLLNFIGHSDSILYDATTIFDRFDDVTFFYSTFSNFVFTAAWFVYMYFNYAVFNSPFMYMLEIVLSVLIALIFLSKNSFNKRVIMCTYKIYVLAGMPDLPSFSEGDE